ncbi:glutathione peroxidase [Aquiflexum balticum DSM 16537]|jgi:glutathione peroxidase|uniref:Glutathione peroxidase n=1 Tax=Aquiflexum balticum DSM 16537 TaxID=758820 RepID=A0A1W2HCA6_9BACT|nr:glutathione peroxidase [Aquiflexum balticum]SMD46186.1 glutathione peroxidase [Aquiflexum balticum DSM 16537]
MKKILIVFAIIAFACTSSVQKQKTDSNQITSLEQLLMEKSIYDFKMKDINGEEVDFSKFKGQKLLLVNVASKCGYTPQYADLQKLHEAHGDKVTIIGFPANNFGGQEPGTNEEIKQFCSENYGVTFKMMDKVSVKGSDKDPLYRWLSDKDLNGWNDKEPSWNFCKYLINENGELVKFFPSSVKPMDEEIIKLIEA